MFRRQPFHASRFNRSRSIAAGVAGRLSERLLVCGELESLETDAWELNHYYPVDLHDCAWAMSLVLDLLPHLEPVRVQF